IDRAIRRGRHRAPIPREVLRMTIGIAGAVVFVVLFLVTNDVVAGEAVMRRQVINRRPRPSKATIKEDGRSKQSGCELGPHGGLATPEMAQGITKLIVPFRKARRMVSKLIAIRSDVPWL